MIRMPPGSSSFIARKLISLYPRRAFDRRLVLGERRRVQHDRVEALPRDSISRSSSNTLPLPLDVREPVAFGVRAHAATAVRGDVDRDHLLRLRRRAAARIRRDTKTHRAARPRARTRRGHRVVLALIEKQARLLSTASRSTSYSDAVRDDLDEIRHLAGQHLDAMLEPFESTDRGSLRARMPCGAALRQDLDDRRQQPVHAPGTASGPRGTRRSDRPPVTAAGRASPLTTR